MPKRKRTEEQTINQETLHRKLKRGTRTPLKTGGEPES
jgi:hypothetical protein